MKQRDLKKMFSFSRLIKSSLFFCLAVTDSASSLEDLTFSVAPVEVLRINQRIVDPEIIESFPEALTVSYVLENIKAPEGEGTDLTKIKVIDLSETYMSVSDFSSFLEAIKDEISSLQVFRLCTVDFTLSSWASFLFPLMETETFLFLDVTATLYSNGGIKKVLNLGHERYGERWLPLSEKIIFSTAKYSYDLSTRVQWVRDYVDVQKTLSPNWKQSHDAYYRRVLKEIDKVPAMHFLSSSDDERADGDASESFSEDDLATEFSHLTAGDVF